MTEQPPIDLSPSADRIMRLIPVIGDDQLANPTPCKGRSVAQLLAHLLGLTAAFRAAAEKDLGPLTDTNPDQDGWPDLEQGWRETLAERLPALVAAWYPPQAWQGVTRAGGVELPADVMGHVALGELTLHGWDLACACGHDYQCDGGTAAALRRYVGGFDEGGTPGMFDPAVPAPEDAGTFEQALARSGRDPGWSPPGGAAGGSSRTPPQAS
jgi:uncharacterized protein (TIGR03086 family)